MSSQQQQQPRAIELRSDTLTLPTQEMYDAMRTAALGDDVYGECPTVNSLEARCAKLFGKEAALFVCSGTMGNFLAVLAHCNRGDEIIVGRDSHVHKWEQGNYAQMGGISASTIEVESDGTLPLAAIRRAIRDKGDFHMPYTRLICLENTHNFAGGKAISLQYMREVRQLADQYSLKIHLDGARIHSAAVALGCDVADVAKDADSVMVCLSKGLGAPVGSIVAGSTEFIERARRTRKAIGGGWRQAGLLAAAGHVALDNADAVIRRDHENAKRLARGWNERTLSTLKDQCFVVEDHITNMVFAHCKGDRIKPQLLADYFAKHNIQVMPMDEHRVRMVLNLHVSADDVDRVLDVYGRFQAEL